MTTEYGQEQGGMRLVLPGVMQVGFYIGGDRCPETVPFPSCLASALRYMGEDFPWLEEQSHGKHWRLNWGNVQILAASGMAFGLLWRQGWHMDNVDLMFVADPNEVIRRAFASVGCGYELVEKRGGGDDEALFKRKILGSLRQGRPVLAFGVIGPPECCLITGIDAGGDVLIGWNYFQGDPAWAAGVALEPDGYFRKRSWFADTHSLILVGDKQQPAEGAETLRDTLRWALQVARTPEVFGRHSGLAAYAAWAKELRDDAAFNSAGEAALREQHSVHHTQVGLLAECRAWASKFLRQTAEGEPAVRGDLLAAAECYMAEHDLMWKAWDLAGGWQDPDAWRNFASPGIRSEIAAVVLQARDLDERAAAHLEAALAKEGHP